jgi:hypothetical protein
MRIACQEVGTGQQPSSSKADLQLFQIQYFDTWMSYKKASCKETFKDSKRVSGGGTGN